MRRMTAEEFLAWAVEQPEGQRYELMDGDVVGVASEHDAHARGKLQTVNALDRATKVAGLTCEIVHPGHRTIIHYARGDADTVSIRILGDGPLRLDPPDIVLDDPFGPA